MNDEIAEKWGRLLLGSKQKPASQVLQLAAAKEIFFPLITSKGLKKLERSHKKTS